MRLLASEGFVVRHLPGTPYVRASVGAWSDEEELDAPGGGRLLRGHDEMPNTTAAATAANATSHQRRVGHGRDGMPVAAQVDGAGGARGCDSAKIGGHADPGPAARSMTTSSSAPQSTTESATGSTLSPPPP